MRSLVLYETSHCHLCEQAEQVLIPFVNSAECQIELVDIVSDDTLMQAHGTEIPVLKDHHSGRLLKWPFDECDVRSFLSACQAQ
ncbi:glutaredoxin family protein [Salinispirillum sp. LH 10-3-1]|uniref:glutaredoxin family protein n=1 Tax=Salinispirillum sp. LH 10-3-1 TaxID=2952525 RepID=UPI00272BD5C4